MGAKAASFDAHVKGAELIAKASDQRFGDGTGRGVGETRATALFGAGVEGELRNHQQRRIVGVTSVDVEQRAVDLAGFIFERGKPTFSRAAIAAISGEILLFASGISWLYVLTHSLARAISLGLYWFIFAEIMKVMLAAGAVNTWRRFFPRSDEADMKAPE